MSKYTTEVRSICEVAAGLTESLGYNSINDILKQAAPNVFNFDWPIFDEAYRLPLEIKILKHFYTREIGLETVGLWKLKLDTKLNEIMPYYNQLYKSELIEFNPLYDVDITRDHEGENTGNHKTDGGFSDTANVSNTAEMDDTTNFTGKVNGTDESTTQGTNNQTNNNVKTVTGKNTNRYSDTPQGALTDLEANTYLTNATIVDDNNSTTDNGTLENTSNVSYNDSSETNTENDTVKRVESNSKSDTTRTGTNYNYSDITDTTKYLEHVTGKQGTASYSKMLQEFRETFLNIDMLVIEELEPLFMQLW